MTPEELERIRARAKQPTFPDESWYDEAIEDLIEALDSAWAQLRGDSGAKIRAQIECFFDGADVEMVTLAVEQLCQDARRKGASSVWWKTDHGWKDSTPPGGYQ